MPYPQNFVVRLIICIVGMYAIWMCANFIGDVVIRHEAFKVGVLDIVLPPILGVIETFAWKPKN